MPSSDSDLLPSERRRAQSPKGKEKMGDATAEEEEATCGICLSSGSLAVRGQIDSCDHHFCFICIMEWAKLESRCPMCKQRFRFISRPEVTGLFSAKRVVEVPVRDQVDHLEDNGSSSPFDPYAQAYCIICHGSQDEELLLLCDLCDSASHTYCTGHGYTVPEGDWYCNDCNILRKEHAKIDLDVNDVKQNYQKNSLGDLTSEQPVSIIDIVADETVSTLEVTALQDLHEAVVCRSSTNENNRSHGRILTTEELESSSVSDLVTESFLHIRCVQQGARTLRHCRNLRSRIQALRQNWNSLRSGSMSFSSTLVYNRDTRFRRTQTSDISQQSKSSPLVSVDQTTQSNTADTIPAKNVPLDEGKAWKMMKKAKILQGSKTQSLPVASSSSSSRRYNHSLKYSGNSTTMSNGGGRHSLTPFVLKNQKATNKMACCSTTKSEVQMLVKLNLKLLSKGQCLGSAKFKEIARSSTHSILAAYGFEHSNTCAHSFPTPACSHDSAGQAQQLQSSSIMPGSCRECFHTFIKYVVKSLLSEKSSSDNPF
ncbi:Methyl-CpG-binding domain-containing protein 9 [Apostasia shenzhenica]|uniref:Methyl-CpG-binding domain-containing protein 9 n=1 Tax=Apostasia shenzhenica TaxID=1088818 RepID=A0A2H9ZSQ3_9ASPA|nr:Methyl-CpG-binding domain-containing protein 9 [Apostasia shenzhenica]